MAQYLAIDVSLVERLIARQFPQWADLPLRPVASGGTDNSLFRLGEDMVVRLPRVDWAAELARTEAAWLPRLGPALPLPTPQPLAVGTPAEGYPWTWTVCRWLEGADAYSRPITDLLHAAEALAGFLKALWAIDTTGGPRSGAGNHFRGVRLTHLDAGVRDSLTQLDGEIDLAATTAAWEQALATPTHPGPRVWLHGDLLPGNLLTRDGRLSAVIDFGLLGVGDPAADLIVAWSVLDAATRPAFRAALGVDDTTWERGRGWAIRNAVGALAFYRHTNPTLTAISRRMLAEALHEGPTPQGVCP
jgi:aminoglycoside phosphotransferase (APT) family kinase protein